MLANRLTDVCHNQKRKQLILFVEGAVLSLVDTCSTCISIIIALPRCHCLGKTKILLLKTYVFTLLTPYAVRRVAAGCLAAVL